MNQTYKYFSLFSPLDQDVKPMNVTWTPYAGDHPANAGKGPSKLKMFHQILIHCTITFIANESILTKFLRNFD